MNFEAIKSFFEFLLKFFTYLKDNKLLSIVRFGVVLLIAYMCFNEFYIRNRFYHDAKRYNIISEKIGNIVRECGKNSFVSWETIDDTKADFRRKKISFNDVVGCLGDENERCPVSVKYSNLAYLKDYYLGYDDYSYLINIRPGVITRCLINGDIQCPEYTPTILKDIIKLTNLKLTEISYVIIKDWKRNLVYIFTLSFAENSINTCSVSGGSMLLDNLATTAMENL